MTTDPDPIPDDLDYEGALAVFLATGTAFGGGLTNHGPMAAEALESMGVGHWIGPFVADYRTRLEAPRRDIAAAPADWVDWFRPHLAELVARAGNLAGHGLLRVAHAVRGIERRGSAGPSSVQLRELGVAVDYWQRGGAGPAGPPELTGTVAPGAWAQGFDRLAPEQRAAGLLTVTLDRAAATPGFADRVAALAPSTDPADTLDALASGAADAFRRNEGIAAFALLHGTTVSAMARVLMPHCDDADTRRLEAAVASFVAAALVGFDDLVRSPDAESAGDHPTPAALAERAGASLEDHTIKFADACIGVAARIGSDGPLAALHHQIETPYGVSR